MRGLEDRVVLVTGGGSGVGRAIVDRFLDEGARLAVLERDADKVASLESIGSKELVTVTGDVTSYADNERAVAAAVETFGRLDVLIGNVGMWDFSRNLVDLSPGELEAGFRDLFAVNVLGYLLGARAAAAALKRSRGAIILTLSNASFYPRGGGVLYTATKHAGLGLVRQLAYELAPEVRVNAVAPGAMATNLTGPKSLGLDRRQIKDIPIQEYLEKHSALERAIEPADYAGTYALLASSHDALTVTGTVFDISAAGTPHRAR
ncbi:3-(cis-5,6-dihydroxycyclohexa-1,3-dien-1-yl)propanoate dehydrogenase [Phytohabitans sp. ZYX-F-186]|uniref:3-(Cis-5,6-dihydroxycyclohexa-1, 3-dien-1-yl)propanoate dehydrogenase n=1 Tax=Phytohabitans maris TaxID=3071409 RepID=A0ABU0ZH50_9ACTN|nr:3-(cis-5,6-dihydroxycyclohexa-1,3-dien-1-yl)propanoate dehydrogenase [Phytohabitans sp. ZYX-F-186]MDQ7905272.1 3-(cis-5,6-dihydroxycyclohexa-1,3-dien-1-yl)propanoate dehydrogenase [Phytohabitans sp. ZYX-F-186]